MKTFQKLLVCVLNVILILTWCNISNAFFPPTFIEYELRFQSGDGKILLLIKKKCIEPSTNMKQVRYGFCLHEINRWIALILQTCSDILSYSYSDVPNRRLCKFVTTVMFITEISLYVIFGLFSSAVRLLGTVVRDTRVGWNRRRSQGTLVNVKRVKNVSGWGQHFLN